jgi:hypothetical protein
LLILILLNDLIYLKVLKLFQKRGSNLF